MALAVVTACDTPLVPRAEASTEQSPPILAATPPDAGGSPSQRAVVAADRRHEAAPPEPRVRAVAVAGDLPALVLERVAAPPRVVFLHGVCGHAGAYLATFPHAGAAAGGVLAMQGDRPCPGQPRYRTYSWDPARLHERIAAAMVASGAPDAWGEVTVVGYSQGATLAEQLVAAHRERYARAVLIGAPRDPDASRLARAAAVATVSCARDVPKRMADAAARLRSRGIAARYFEMPGCTHGGVGDGERVFSNIFEFLAN